MDNFEKSKELQKRKEQITNEINKIENFWILDQIMLFVHNIVKE